MLDLIITGNHVMTLYKRVLNNTFLHLPPSIWEKVATYRITNA